jgi:FecR protein
MQCFRTQFRAFRVAVPALLALASLSIAPTLTAAGAVAENDSKQEPYVVLVTQGDETVQAVFGRYPELKGSWDELARYNLLRAGNTIEVPRDMLDTDGVLAKVGSFYGESEVKRSFDDRYLPVVKNLLLREGDEIRTWRGAGVRILFEDGNYVLLRSNSRARVVSLGSKKASAASRMQLFLKEGSVWSEMEHGLRGRFEIQTPSASTIIRGTEFRVKVEPGEATRLEVLDGRVDFGVGERTVSVAKQEGALATGSEPVVTTALPSPPALEAPLQQEVIRADALDQVFRWQKVEGAESYDFEIARDEEFFDVMVERSVGPEASVRIQSLEPGTYFWRTSTVVHGFEGSPSATRYFVFVQLSP